MEKKSINENNTYTKGNQSYIHAHQPVEHLQRIFFLFCFVFFCSQLASGKLLYQTGRDVRGVSNGGHGWHHIWSINWSIKGGTFFLFYLFIYFRFVYNTLELFIYCRCHILKECDEQ